MECFVSRLPLLSKEARLWRIMFALVLHCVLFHGKNAFTQAKSEMTKSFISAQRIQFWGSIVSHFQKTRKFLQRRLFLSLMLHRFIKEKFHPPPQLEIRLGKIACFNTFPIVHASMTVMEMRVPLKLQEQSQFQHAWLTFGNVHADWAVK